MDKQKYFIKLFKQFLLKEKIIKPYLRNYKRSIVTRYGPGRVPNINVFLKETDPSSFLRGAFGFVYAASHPVDEIDCRWVMINERWLHTYINANTQWQLKSK